MFKNFTIIEFFLDSLYYYGQVKMLESYHLYYIQYRINEILMIPVNYVYLRFLLNYLMYPCVLYVGYYFGLQKLTHLLFYKYNVYLYSRLFLLIEIYEFKFYTNFSFSEFFGVLFFRHGFYCSHGFMCSLFIPYVG